MLKNKKSIVFALGMSVLSTGIMAATPKICPPDLAADSPTVPLSMEQADINSGKLKFDQINDHGELLFVTKFNQCDGRGRPETTGGGDKRAVPTVLLAQRAGLPDGTHVLTTKGIDFEIEISGGVVVEAEGIDHDLIIKPFHQAGKVISLREFTDNAMNHHHGMQAEERFDLNPGKAFDPDYDNDGVARELTIGDITAITIWQAQLSTPVQVLPKDENELAMIEDGEMVFDDLGCASCHIPELVLNKRNFVEPNPYNPPGTCRNASEGCPDYAFDMTKTGDLPRLHRPQASQPV